MIVEVISSVRSVFLPPPPNPQIHSKWQRVSDTFRLFSWLQRWGSTVFHQLLLFSPNVSLKKSESLHDENCTDFIGHYQEDSWQLMLAQRSLKFPGQELFDPVVQALQHFQEVR